MTFGKKWFWGCGAAVAGIVLVLILGVSYVLNARLGPEGAYFDSSGVRIHYTDEGQGAPVVLVHGFSNPAHLQWRKPGIIQELAKAYRVIAPDARGHGRSDRRYTPEECGLQMVEDLVRLLDHLHIDRAHVVGYSMGGYTVLKMACTHPERLLSVSACAAGWLQATEENRDFGEAVARAIETRQGFGPLLSRLGLPDRPMSLWERIMFNVALTFVHDPKALAAVSRSGIQLTLTEDELRANKTPALTIIGSEDGLLPEARALANAMANHRLVILEGQNHINTGASPRFLEELLPFLREHTPKESVEGAKP